MDEPWGINGPDLLALYGALLLAPALVSLVWWQLQKRRSRPGAGLPTGLSTYQLAWLAGGPVRAAQAAFVTLLERGAVRISSSGFLTRVDEEAGDPPEKAALSASTSPTPCARPATGRTGERPRVLRPRGRARRRTPHAAAPHARGVGRPR